MRSRRRLSSLLFAVVLVALPVLAGTTVAADPQRSSHAQVLAYWTPERVQSAKARGFVYSQGRFEPAAKPEANSKPGGGGGGGGSKVTGAQWPDFKGDIYRSVGRVLFTLNSGNYICSGSVVSEAESGRSIVLTAAHCAYDKQDGGFARNWMFIPEFDTDPTYTCSASTHGCWTATSLVVHAGFANESGFTATATHHDWAFAVIGQGGKSNTQLDATIPSFPIAFTDYASKTQVHATGYPAGGKYSPGHELIYCSGPVEFDRWNGNRTYKLGCDMTGGSSGGPWLTSFDGTGNTGILSSVNSYTYVEGNAMHGPKFNSKTQATFSRALTTNANAIVN
jgi:V8-like Glu-specific endopeptidase